MLVLLLGLSMPVSSSLAIEIKCAPGSTFVKCPKSVPTPVKKIAPTKQPSLRNGETAKKCFESSKTLGKCLAGG